MNSATSILNNNRKHIKLYHVSLASGLALAVVLAISLGVFGGTTSSSTAITNSGVAPSVAPVRTTPLPKLVQYYLVETLDEAEALEQTFAQGAIQLISLNMDLPNVVRNYVVSSTPAEDVEVDRMIAEAFHSFMGANGDLEVIDLRRP